MALSFHPLTVKKIQPETPDCVSIWLDVPEHLKEIFAYQPGQHLTLRIIINGQEVRRTYSLCSSPQSGQWRVAVKQVTQGIFSNHAFTSLKPGDVLEALPPGGRFSTSLNAAYKKHYAAFAAGSGITPILSIIEATLRTEPESHFTIIYGNRNRSHIIFREELEALKNRYINRFILQFVLSQESTDVPLQHGRIDREKCDLIFSRIIDVKNIDAYFLCGPQEMIFTVKDYLEEQEVDSSKIHFELFTAVKATKPAVRENITAVPGNLSMVTLKLDGITSSFPLSFDGPSILDAALQQGANLPYACKGGVCSTCKARLTEGQVQMDVNYALQPDEVAAGFILTCQSHPVSSTVRIDFDAI